MTQCVVNRQTQTVAKCTSQPAPVHLACTPPDSPEVCSVQCAPKQHYSNHNLCKMAQTAVCKVHPMTTFTWQEHGCGVYLALCPAFAKRTFPCYMWGWHSKVRRSLQKKGNSENFNANWDHFLWTFRPGSLDFWMSSLAVLQKCLCFTKYKEFRVLCQQYANHWQCLQVGPDSVLQSAACPGYGESMSRVECRKITLPFYCRVEPALQMDHSLVLQHTTCGRSMNQLVGWNNPAFKIYPFHLAWSWLLCVE